MLYLNEKNIKEAVSLNEMMDVIEESFHIYEKNSFFMPDRIHVNKDDKTLLYMPCFKDSIFGTKMLSLFPENPKKNLPVITGLMLLNDIETGIPLALINGADLTAYRTGAVGGVGVRHTTPKNVKKLGLIGAGVQGFYQVLFACEARDFDQVMIFDAYSKGMDAFAEKLQKEFPDIKIIIANSSEELVKMSEVIITATPSATPVIPDDKELLQGKHFIGLGSYKPNMREYPQSLYELIDNVYVDTEFAEEESGDIITPLKENWIKKDQIKLFSNLLTGTAITGDTTLYKFVGMGLFDLAVSELIYKMALIKNLGQKIIL
ncbi:ornithine cyclodeaminase family protein [Psychrilyobacter sp.]|uniref:ornithine cyclodeaminase family protein n=1 Tax=Psychrilyobacter sp. TaxID=2586924 RepID=UPI00301A0DC2